MSGTFSFPLSTKIDTKHAIAQNKIMVIDGQTVITGSFNFTTAAEEHNAENLLVIRDKDLAAKYAANWKVHADHSDPYAGRTEGYSQSHRTAPAVNPSSTVDPVSGGYVASTNSKGFHRPDCNSAAKISERNLVRYATREEPVQAGKKPCAECRESLATTEPREQASSRPQLKTASSRCGDKTRSSTIHSYCTPS